MTPLAMGLPLERRFKYFDGKLVDVEYDVK